MPSQPRLRVLTPAERDALWSVLSRPRDRAAISLMLDAGLRASEVVTLTLDSLDWTDQVLRFTGKGGTPAELPINSRLRDALERAITARPPQATHPYLLYDLRNPAKPITRFALLRLVKTAARKAGIQRRVFCHLLRHTFGTCFFRETGDLGRTQAAMRHRKIATTTIYMHLTPQDQRPDFERLDTRPWFLRWWSRLRPVMIPDILRRRPRPMSIGETIGRERELAQLRQGVRSRMHTVLIGERGVGRRHLLRHVAREYGVAIDGVEESHHGGDGEKAEGAEKGKRSLDVYWLEVFSPARECLVTLCEMLKARGILKATPTGRSDKIFLNTLRRVGPDHALTLLIDSITDLTKKERTNLRKLAERWTIVTTIDRKQQGILGMVFFGNCQRIEVNNFDKSTALLFARKAMGNMGVPDTTAYLQHVYAQSQGNPQAILELIETTRKTGETAPTHAVMQKVLPASFFLAVFLMVGFVARYSATTLSAPTVRLYAVLFIVCMVILTAFDKILKAKAQ